MTAQLPSTEYTLEDLREIAYCGSYDDMQRSLARALLAVHEQEPVAYIAFYESGLTHGVCNKDDTVKMEWLKRGFSVKPLYSHPAPSIPAAVPEVDADDNFYSWFGREWYENYQQNQYTAAAKQMLGVMAESAWKASRRAAMLQSEPEKQKVTLRDGIQALRDLGGIDAEKILAERDALNECTDDERIMAIEGISVVKLPPEFYSSVGRVVQVEKVMAALAIAGIEYERPQNAPQNIPENILGGLIVAVIRLLDSDGSRGCFDLIECNAARREIERLLAAAPKGV